MMAAAMVTWIRMMAFPGDRSHRGNDTAGTEVMARSKERPRAGRASQAAGLTARAIASAARLGPLVVLTHRSLRDLIAELGDMESAFRHLHRVLENVGKPI